MTMTKQNKLPFTLEQLKVKLLRDDDCAINALLKLLEFEVYPKDMSFLVSLRDQVIWRRRDHERDLNLEKPLLSPKQLACLRQRLTECYLNTLYIIAEKRWKPHDTSDSKCYCEQIPYSDEPTLCSYCNDEVWTAPSWFCSVCDGLAVIEHCGLRYCREHYNEKRAAEANVDPYDLRNLNSLTDGEEGR